MPIRLIPGNRASGNLHSRKLGFRLTQFSETQRAWKEPGLLDHVSLTADRQAILSRATTSSMAVLCSWRPFSSRGSGAASWCWGEAVASHHFGERRRVGRAVSCGLDNGSHLAEVVKAEDARSDDGEHLRVDLMVVVEAVDDSARNAQHLARTDLGLLSVDRPGQYALKTVDRLLVTVMAVRNGHSGLGWDVEFEDCDRTSRRLALQYESNRQLPDTDLFAWARRHAYSSCSRCFGCCIRYLRLFFTHSSAAGPPVLATLDLLTSIHSIAEKAHSRKPEEAIDHKESLVPVHRWGKGKEESDTRIMNVFSLHIYSTSIHLKM